MLKLGHILPKWLDKLNKVQHINKLYRIIKKQSNHREKQIYE
jgi:hypothetical protein